MKTYSLFIDGEMIPAAQSEVFESTNPYNEEVVAVLSRGRSGDIDKAVAAARKAFDEGPWPRLSNEERSAYLHQIATLLQERSKELVQLMVEESGSTLRKAKGEVHQSGKQMAYFADLAKTPWEEDIPQLSRPGISENTLVREPIGVCGQIIPWNFPLQMAVWKVGLALACGNTVVLKPAEETSAIAMAFAEIIQAANLPKGVVNVVTGFGEEAGAPLASHPGVDKIAFTGSTEVGKKIMQLAAPTMKRVTLECGGKSANIVFEDADLEMAVDGSLFAMFFNSGQCCTAGSRLFLQESIYEAFVQKLLEKAQQMTLGNPMDKETDLGPLVSKKQQDRVLHYIEIGKKEGAQCFLDGSLSQTGGTISEALGKACFVGPTIFTHVENQMKIAQEEIFGPVLCVIPFKTEEEVIALANASDFGLSAGVWSQNDEKALRVAKRLRSGTVWVNEYHLISEKAPFGGFKQSGLGRELGMEGLKAYTEVKHIHLDQLKSRDKKFWYDSVLAPKVKI